MTKKNNTSTAPPTAPLIPPAAKPFRFDHATEQYAADRKGMTVLIDEATGFAIELAGPTSDEARAARHANALEVVRVVPLTKEGMLDGRGVGKYEQVRLIEGTAIELYARRTRSWVNLASDDAGTPTPCTYENALTLYRARADIIAKLREADRERNATFRRDRADAGGVRGVVRTHAPANRRQGHARGVSRTSTAGGKGKGEKRAARAGRTHAPAPS
jgi:hypothetical protein